MLKLDFLKHGRVDMSTSGPCGYAILKKDGVYFVSQAPSGCEVEYLLGKLKGHEDVEPICVVRTDEWIREYLEERTRKANAAGEFNGDDIKQELAQIIAKAKRGDLESALRVYNSLASDNSLSIAHVTYDDGVQK